MHAPRKRSRWETGLHRSAFLLGAILLHLVVFLMVATWIVYPAPPLPSSPTVHFVPQPVADAVPPSPPPGNPGGFHVNTSSTITPVDSSSILVPLKVPNVAIDAGPIDWKSIRETISSSPPAGTNAPVGLPPERLKRIHEAVLRYRTQEEINRRDPASKFPVYVASYAGGDWACNIRLNKNGDIVAGSLPDLVAKIGEWSHGEIHGEVVPKPLNIGSGELLDKMPPFIFFTGHKDFVLAEREIEHLRDYLQNGGAIWGDNALAGRGSRFDQAFHREMQRVVPNHPFEALPIDDELFSQVPEGMNYRAEPLEHLDIDSKLAILYTPNDYSDLFSMRILPGDAKIQLGRPDPASPLTTNWLFERHSDVFFRNFTIDSSLAVHRLGMNIVTYLLTRWDDLLMLGQ